MQTVNNGVGEIFFLDAPGGTGKTFLIKLILATIWSQNDIALALCIIQNSCNITARWKNCSFCFKITFKTCNSLKLPCVTFSKYQVWEKYCRNANLLFGMNAQWRTKKNHSSLLIDHCKICVKNVRLFGDAVILHSWGIKKMATLSDRTPL